MRSASGLWRELNLAAVSLLFTPRPARPRLEGYRDTSCFATFFTLYSKRLRIHLKFSAYGNPATNLPQHGSPPSPLSIWHRRRCLAAHLKNHRGEVFMRPSIKKSMCYLVVVTVRRRLQSRPSVILRCGGICVRSGIK